MPRTRRTAAIAIALAATATLSAAATTSAQAAGSLHLAEIYYNSPGTDTRTNTSLNAEWVKITNSTTRYADLTGWTLTDASAHKYTFGKYSLAPGKSVRIHTGRGTNTSTDRYQGRSAYVWNNDKDKATLRKSTGTLVDTCAYNNSHQAYTYC